MTTDVELFLNWRSVPSGIAWGDEIERTQPQPGTLRLSALPSFHFEPCDSAAVGNSTPPPVEIPPGLIQSLEQWPDVLTRMHFRVQVEQLAKVSAGITEDYATPNAFDVVPVPQPTAADVALGIAL